MWKSTDEKVYCLTCGEKIVDNTSEDGMVQWLIGGHLGENPDHICIKGHVYKQSELDDKEDHLNSIDESE